MQNERIHAQIWEYSIHTRGVKRQKKSTKKCNIELQKQKSLCTLASSAFISDQNYPSTQHVVHINHMDKSVDKTKERARWGVKNELGWTLRFPCFFPFKPWLWKNPTVRRWWKWGTGGKRQKRITRALEAWRFSKTYNATANKRSKVLTNGVIQCKVGKPMIPWKVGCGSPQGFWQQFPRPGGPWRRGK